jgi:hypothetical protein
MLIKSNKKFLPNSNPNKDFNEIKSVRRPFRPLELNTHIFL